MQELFSIKYRVVYADTDQMGVVYHANFLIYFERVRNEALRAIKLPYTKLELEGIMLPVVLAHCEYKNPAIYDDLLTIKMRISNYQKCKINFEYEVIGRKKLLVTGYTTHVSVDRKTRKPIPLPEKLMKFANLKKI